MITYTKVNKRLRAGCRVGLGRETKAQMAAVARLMDATLDLQNKIYFSCFILLCKSGLLIGHSLKAGKKGHHKHPKSFQLFH